MRSLSLYLIIALMSALCGFCCVSCDVHEFPGVEIPEEPVPERPSVKLQISLDGLDWEELTTVEWSPDRAAGRISRSGSRATTHAMRFNLHIYDDDDASSRMSSRNLQSSRVWVIDVPDALGDVRQLLDLNLAPGEYTALVWIDYIDADAPQADLYYDTSDLSAVSLLGDDHPGNSHYREAFRGSVRFAIDGEGHVMDSDSRAPVEVVSLVAERPMARYEIVSTDLDEFIKTNITPRSAEVSSGSPSTAADSSGSTSVAAAADPSGAPSVATGPDLDDYIVNVRYASYMPTTYNCRTNRPVDARTGVHYRGEIVRKSEHEATLGFDHVFVNGSQTSVQVAVDVYSRITGHLVASTDPITVPLQRNRHTFIKGKFLTTKASGGAGINPDFSGEFNIEIK